MEFFNLEKYTHEKSFAFLRKGKIFNKIKTVLEKRSKNR